MEILEREVEILDPQMPIVQKIGRHARICYKVEKEADFETDCRIIGKCIKDGHESILEHGIISVFLQPQVTDDSKRISAVAGAKNPISLPLLWTVASTNAAKKFIEQVTDPDLYEHYKSRYNISGQERRLLPCLAGDVRAWRQAMRERIFMASQNHNQAQYIFTLKIIHELNKVDHGKVLFKDIYDDMNEILKEEKIRETMLPKDLELKTWTVASIVDHYFKETNSVFADEGSPTLSLSVILTTDRATTHQLVRHRQEVAYSQESQRYVNYGKKGCCCMPMVIDPKKCPEGIKIDPFTGNLLEGQEAYDIWIKTIENCFQSYEKLLALGIPTESARGVLPNDAKTKIGVTWFRCPSYINLNFWRLEGHAQYAIRRLMYLVMFEMTKMHHPYSASIPHHLVIKWLEQMKEQKIIPEEEQIDKLIADRKKLQAVIAKMLQDAEAPKKTEKK